MSTVVVVRKDGLAAIGGDTLTTFGSTKESAEYVRNHSKILRVGASYLAHVGHASFDLLLADYFASLDPPPALGSAVAIFRMACDLHRALKERYFVNPSEDDDDDFESSRLHCLIANEAGIYGLCSERSVMEYTRFTAFGQGYKFALGAMKVAYDLPLSAAEVARLGLEAAAEFDDATGLPVEVYTVPLQEGSEG
jgi:ATP-dependent protease HslVU (ClpYQ) peptidase subunit